MTQVTLISLWGEKRGDFASLITECHAFAARLVGDAFVPYELQQVHATIVGLERLQPSVRNANFATHRSRDIDMDFDGFLSYLRASGHIPFEVQIGGFSDRDYPFTSRSISPYERSFSIQGDKVVVMGWPTYVVPLAAPSTSTVGHTQKSRIYPQTLDILRHEVQRYGILHNYHRSTTEVDNDLFFRIGLIDPLRLTQGMKSSLEAEARQFLSNRQPLVFKILLDDIYVAAYEDNRLPLSSTRSYSLADPKLTGGLVAGLYK